LYDVFICLALAVSIKLRYGLVLFPVRQNRRPLVVVVYVLSRRPATKVRQNKIEEVSKHAKAPHVKPKALTPIWAFWLFRLKMLRPMTKQDVIKVAVSVVKNNATTEMRLESAAPKRLQRASRPTKNEIKAQTRDMR